MGSPISPTLADIVMQDIEITILQNLNFAIYIYYRSKDDTSLIIPSNKQDYI